MRGKTTLTVVHSQGVWTRYTMPSPSERVQEWVANEDDIGRSEDGTHLRAFKGWRRAIRLRWSADAEMAQVDTTTNSGGTWTPQTPERVAKVILRLIQLQSVLVDAYSTEELWEAAPFTGTGLQGVLAQTRNKDIEIKLESVILWPTIAGGD